MAAIIPDSKYFTEIQPQELDLFSLPGTQTAVERTYLQDCRPISAISGDNPIEFNVSTQEGLEYIDLRRSMVYMRCRITKEDGTHLTVADECGPVNLFMHSMFSQVDVRLQGRLITSTNNHYPYKAIIQTILNTNEVNAKSKMTSQLFYKDTESKMEDTDPNGDNQGLLERWKIAGNSKVFDMAGVLMHDLFNIDRYILNQVDVQVKLYRTNPKFALMATNSNESYAINIEDIVLKVMKVKVNPGVIWGHNTALSTTTAKYPFKRTEVKMMSIPTGQASLTYDNIFQGARPNKVVVGFVSSKAVAGDLNKNPYNFANYDVTSIGLYCDGESVSETSPMKISFDESHGECIIPPYVNLFRYNDTWFANDSDPQATSSVYLNRKEFASGYALYVFPIEPTFGPANDRSYLTLKKKGSIRLEAQFGKALTETVTCIVYAEFGDGFQIEKSRNIIV